MKIRYKKGRLMMFAVPAACLVAFVLPMPPASGQDPARDQITRPMVSEDACPLEAIEPVARDGYRGQGFLRKPPGAGPFPAVVWIHGGLNPWPLDRLKEVALLTQSSRFLAAGYVVAVIDFRSREQDPQSMVSLEDSLAAVDYLRRAPYVDPASIVIYGCSGGGDLALEIAAAPTEVCAIVAEEPASFIFAGVFNANFPKRGERLVSGDSEPIGKDPKRYYTPEYQRLTRAKISRIRAPILILQGDQDDRAVPFNNQVLIPELRAARRNVEVISYPGQPHCFAFFGSGPRTPRPAAALKAFQDADAFYRRHLKTKPKALDPSLVKHVPVPPA